MFDNTNAPSWELLRLRPEFVSTPDSSRRFARPRRAARSFQAPALHPRPRGRGIGIRRRSGAGRDLRPGRPAFGGAGAAAQLVGAVIPLIRRLTSALADLQDQGADVAHGALTADRIMVARDGRLIIREHVLGSALARLRLPAGRLWTDLGIMAWPTHLAVPDARSPDGRRQLGTRRAVADAQAGASGRRWTIRERIDDLLDRIGESDGAMMPVFTSQGSGWSGPFS